MYRKRELQRRQALSLLECQSQCVAVGADFVGDQLGKVYDDAGTIVRFDGGNAFSRTDADCLGAFRQVDCRCGQVNCDTCRVVYCETQRVTGNGFR